MTVINVMAQVQNGFPLIPGPQKLNRGQKRGNAFAFNLSCYFVTTVNFVVLTDVP